MRVKLAARGTGFHENGFHSKNEVGATPFIIGTVALHSAAKLWRRYRRIQESGHERKVLGDVAHELKEADGLASRELMRQRQEKSLIGQCNHYKSCVEKDAKLDFGYVVEFLKIEMALPCFEDVFNPPPQAIQRQDFFEGYPGIGNRSKKYRPGHQLQ